MTTQAPLLKLKAWLESQVVGQEDLIQRLLIAMLADGHLLVEGAPGLAKTRAIKSLAQGIEAKFNRIQFTPDMLPADVTGSEIYRPQTGEFEFQQGPVFAHLVLADEINRAPAKVQSSLLEAMAERQVSVGKKTYGLPSLFLVMATQNPIEQEGTYPLPEAQMDRFLMHVSVDYPDIKAEHKILKIARKEAANALRNKTSSPPKLSQEQLMACREEVLQVSMMDSIVNYIVQLAIATRKPAQYSADLAAWIEYGVSPRATIALDLCAKAHAWLDQRDYVTPHDVQMVLPNVYRHRIGASFYAEADGVTKERIIDELMNLVPSP